MNHQQTKEILALYRPGTADANDPFFTDALLRCEEDPDLKRWFEKHCALYFALRAKFRQVAVPEGLKEQILAERKVQTMPLRRRPAILAAAALVVVLAAGLIAFWPRSREDRGIRAYSERMVSTALRNYPMGLATNDPVQVRSYLAQRGAPSDYVVPEALQKAALTGCAIESWQGAKVSMICFDSGRAHRRGQFNDLWLFVADTAALQGAPLSTSPALVRISRAATASWSQGGKTYFLVADGDESFIRNYL